MLAVARGLGETAPILLTALGNDFFNTNPFQPMDAVPLRVYNYAQSAVVNQPPMAFAGAICLLVIVLALSITREDHLVAPTENGSGERAWKSPA